MKTHYVVLLTMALMWIASTIFSGGSTPNDHYHPPGENPAQHAVKELYGQKPFTAKPAVQPQVIIHTAAPTPLPYTARNYPHNRTLVHQYMQYWKTGGRELIKQPDPGDQYLLFTVDCGGFNNIRIAFEHNVVIAWLTRRTLVLPPPTGWYLIDWGPFSVMIPQNHSGVTDYTEFFDIDSLASAVPVISSAEFIHRNKDRFKIPDKFDKPTLDHGERGEYQKFWISQNVHLPWGLHSNVLYWPNIAEVEKVYNVPIEHIANRKKIEYTPEIRAMPVVNFPSCHGEDEHGNGLDYRWLGQVSATAAYADPRMSIAMKRMLRNHVHYPPIVFDIASRVVAQLGMFKYSSAHIRRNDLQYKEVFISAEETLKNIRPMLNPGETLYLSTDETSQGFFDALEKEFKVFRIDDFKTEKGGNVLTGVEIPRKLVGIVEQAICAMGRRFFATKASTFSSYITRLRGYMDAPDKNHYWHNNPHTGDPEKDKQFLPRYWGQEYMSEDESMWLLTSPPAGPPFNESTYS